jgi:glycosyltransferase involved in cell wall biosynthesis
MALRVPVIGTDVDGLPDTLADDRGIVVPAGDAVALAQAIGDVLAGRRVTDLAGAHRYALRFSTERVSAEYAAAYRDLVSGPVADDAAAARSVVQA